MTATSAIPIGTVGFDGPEGRTFARVTAVELQDTFRGVPGAKQLRRLRRDAGETFAFVLRAPVVLTDPAGAAAGKARPRLSYLPENAWPREPFDTGELGQAAWRWLGEAAGHIGARAVLLQAGATFRPTAPNRQRLRTFLEKVAITRPARLLWDGQGLWSPEDSAALCKDLDLVPALDPLVDALPPDGHAYLRVIGRHRTEHGLSADDLHLIGEAREELAWGVVAFHTPRAYRDATALQQLLGVVVPRRRAPAGAEEAPVDGPEDGDDDGPMDGDDVQG